jgi:hypothetical protein
MSEKQTELSTDGQDMGPFKAVAPFKFTDVQSLQLAIQFGILCRDLRDGTRRVCGLSQAHTRRGHDRAVACAGRSFPDMEPDGGPCR